jgi:hypothetical protein
MKTIEEVKTVVAAANQHDVDLFWYINDDDEVRAAVNVNDVFFWGCSDCEDVEAEDVPLFNHSFTLGGHQYGAEIYAARKRGMRPQNAVVNKAPHEVKRALLDAGPVREVGAGNPKELET